MDIVDLLANDHVKIRDELETMKQALYQAGLTQRIERFIMDYRLHEKIEEELLFPAVRGALKDEADAQWLAHYGDKHKQVWTLLHEWLESLKTEELLDIQEAFLHFALALEAHMDYEEENLFYFAKHHLDTGTREALWWRAQDSYLPRGYRAAKPVEAKA